MNSQLIDFLLDKKSKGLPMNVGQAMSELNMWREGKVESVSRPILGESASKETECSITSILTEARAPDPLPPVIFKVGGV